jgi:hypothetical protein
MKKTCPWQNAAGGARIKLRYRGLNRRARKAMANKMWGLRKEKEDEYRSKLLLRARTGDVEAEHELMKKYGMRVYSDTERSKMPTYYDSGKKGSPPSLTSDSARASVQPKRVASQGKAKSIPEPKKRPKITAKANKK